MPTTPYTPDLGGLSKLYDDHPYAAFGGEIDLMSGGLEFTPSSLMGRRQQESFSILGAISELGEGFISGFTALEVGEASGNVYEQIFRSVGHLLGFVGFVPGAGTAASLAAKSSVRAFGLGAKALGAYGRIGLALKGRSIPMLVANKVVGPSSLATKTLKTALGGKILADIAVGSAHLGVASAVGSAQYGIDEMAKSFGMGAVFGAGFRGIGNIVGKGGLIDLGLRAAPGSFQAKYANNMVRGMAASMFQGLPATIQDAPLPTQIYEYLLGAYFGVHEMPYQIREAKQFTADFVKKPENSGTKNLFDYREQEGYRNLSTEGKEQVDIDMENYLSRMYNVGSDEYTDMTKLMSLAMMDEGWGIEFTARFQGKLEAQEMLSYYNDAVQRGMEHVEAVEWAKKEFASSRREQEGWTPEAHQEAMEDLAAEQRPEGAGRPERVDRMDPERETTHADQMRGYTDHDVPTPLTHPIDDFAEQIYAAGPKIKQEGTVRDLSLREIREDVSTQIHKALEEGTSFDDFVFGLQRRYMDTFVIREGEEVGAFIRAETDRAVPTEDMPEYRALRQAWKTVAQNTHRVTRGSYNQKTGEVTILGDLDPAGRRAVEMVQPSLIDETLSAHDMRAIRVDTAHRGTATGKVYEATDPFTYAREAAEGDRPVMFGEKDKGRYWHSDGWLYERVGPILNGEGTKGVSEIGDIGRVVREKLIAMDAATGNTEHSTRFMTDLQEFVREAMVGGGNEAALRGSEWFQKHGFRTVEEAQNYLGNLFHKMYLNNVVMLEQMQGISVEEMITANKNGADFITNPTAFNKRTQMFAAAQPRADAGFIEARMPELKDGMRYVIVNETRVVNGEALPTGEGVDPRMMWGKAARQFAAKHHLDGVFLVRDDVFELYAKDGGLRSEVGAIKGSMVYSGEAGVNGAGIVIGKYAIFPAGQRASAGMGELHGVMYATAAKQRGRRAKYDYFVKGDGTMEFYREGTTERVEPEVNRAPMSGIRIDAANSEKISQLEDVRAVVQLAANLDNPAASAYFVDTFMRPSWNGTAEAREKVEEFLADPNRPVDDIRVSDMSLRDIARVLFAPGQNTVQNNKLYQHIWKEVLRETQKHVIDPVGEGPEGVEMINMGNDYVKTRFNDMVESNTLSPINVYGKYTAKQANAALRTYFLRRLSRPVIPRSASVIFGPSDPWMQQEIAALNGGREFAARTIGESVDGQGREVMRKGGKGRVLVKENGEIAEGAFMLDDGHRAKVIDWLEGKSATLGEAWDQYMTARRVREKGGKDASKLLDKKLHEMERLLHFQMIRVPADSPSGTRSLQFAGFTGRKGFGTRLSNEDMMYLGGADLDIDKGFLFQNLDRFAGGKEFAMPRNQKWGFQRLKKGGLEVSTKGDRFSRQFSDMRAKIGGKTIREIFETEVKGYRSVADGRGKPGLHKGVDLGEEYLKLWRQWADENPAEFAELARRAEGKTLTSSVSRGNINEAWALSELLNERFPTMGDTRDPAMRNPIRRYLTSPEVRYQWYDPAEMAAGRRVWIDTKEIAKKAFSAETEAMPTHDFAHLNPVNAIKIANIATQGNDTLGVFAIAGRRAMLLRDALGIPKENMRAFDALRAGGLNLSADIAGEEGVWLDPERAAKELDSVLFRGMKLTKAEKEYKKSLKIGARVIDMAARGKGVNMSGEVIRELTFEEIVGGSARNIGAQQVLDMFRGAAVNNAYYRGITEGLMGVQVEPLTRDRIERNRWGNWAIPAGTSPMTYLHRAVGLGADKLRLTISDLQRRAQNGNKLAQAILAYNARENISLFMPGERQPSRRRAFAAGDSDLPPVGRRPYTDPFQVENDLHSAVSAIFNFRMGERIVDKYGEVQGLDHINRIALKADELKSRFQGAMRSDRHRAGAQSAERIMQEGLDYRNSLESRELQDFWDAYVLGSFRPQVREAGEGFEPITREEHMRVAEEKFRTDMETVRALEGGDTPLTNQELRRAFIESGEQAAARNEYDKTYTSAFGLRDGVTHRRNRQLFLKLTDEMIGATHVEGITGEQIIGKALADPTYDAMLAAVVGRDAATAPIHKADEFTSDFFQMAGIRALGAEELFDPAKVGKEKAAENKQIYERFRNLFLKYPQLANHFPEIFAEKTGAPDINVRRPFGVVPEMASRADVMRFLSYFESAENSTLAKHLEKGKFPIKILDMMMPEYYGRHTRLADMQVSSQTLVRPTMTKDGIKDVRVRQMYSHFDKLYEVMSRINALSTEVAEKANAEYQQQIDPFRAAMGDVWQDAHELAVAQREYRVRRERASSPEDDRKLLIYKRRVEKLEHLYKKHKGRTFIVNTVDEAGNPVQRQMSFREIVGDERGTYGEINRIYTREANRIYDTLINNPEQDKKFFRYLDDEGEILDFMTTVKELSREFERAGTTATTERFPTMSITGWMRVAHMQELVTSKLIRGYYKDGRWRTLDEPTTMENLFATRRGTRNMTESQRRDYTDTLRHYLRENPVEGFDYIDTPDGVIKQRRNMIIGRLNADEYWPHMMHDKKEVAKWLAKVQEEMLSNGIPLAEQQARLNSMKRFVADGIDPEGGLADTVREALLNDPQPIESVARVDRRPGFTRSRGDEPLPGWSGREDAWQNYLSSVTRAQFNYARGIFGTSLSRRMEVVKPFGNVTPQYVKWANDYIRTAFGGPSFFPESHIRDPQYQLDKTLMWKLSDHNAFRKFQKIDEKWFGGKWLAGVEPGTPEAQRFIGALSRFSMMEGKYEMMTLLANTRGMTYNTWGASQHTIQSAGFENWYHSLSFKYLKSIMPHMESMADVERFVVEKIGGIESHIIAETGDGFWRGGRAQGMFQEVAAKLRKDPNMSDANVADVFRKYGFSEELFKGAAWFMRTVERKVRRHAAMAHYLNARRVFEASGYNIPHDHPWLLEIARKGVEATQFMYDNANRPAFARSSLGRVFARFQIWSWRAIDFRRRMYKEAKAAGFSPGTPEFDRFGRMMTIDMFLFGLANVFPHTMFESALPAPWSYLQDFSDFFFGDEETRDQAFFGTIPYPFSPLQVVMPPIARLGTNFFRPIFSNDWDRFASYHVWSMVPFGLLGRNLYRSTDNPSMTLDFMTGIPMHRIGRRVTEYRDQPEPYRHRYFEKEKGEPGGSPFGGFGDDPFVTGLEALR